jgi:hypothetical protein
MVQLRLLETLAISSMLRPQGFCERPRRNILSFSEPADRAWARRVGDRPAPEEVNVRSAICSHHRGPGAERAGPGV